MVTDDDSPSATVSTGFNSAAYYQIVVKVSIDFDPGTGDDTWHGEDTITISQTAVGVSKIQWRRPADTDYQDVGGTMNVLKGTRVIFKAIPSPSGASWPADEPVWSGSAGISGTGETKDATFNTLSMSLTDYKTVTVTAGNTSTANVVAYDLTPITEPVDDFVGRSKSQFGVGEDINLSYETQPAGITPDVVWRYYSGPGSVVGSLLTAGASPGTIVVRAWIESGPSQDEYRDVSRTIVAPSGAYMQQASGTGVRHVSGYISVGFKGSIWLEPKNVSFVNMQLREGTVKGVGSGCWAYLDEKPHEIGSWIAVGSGNSVTGCIVLGTDTVNAGDVGPPFTQGDFVWNIPWQYRVGTSAPTQFTTAQHPHWADPAPNLGRAHISKKGAGPFVKDAADPTSSY